MTSRCTFPGFSIPSIPTISFKPIGLFELPSWNVVLPSFALDINITLPNIRDLSLPTISFRIPGELKLPKKPTIPTLSFDFGMDVSFALPAIPTISIPSYKIPKLFDLPSIPTLPSCPLDKMRS